MRRAYDVADIRSAEAAAMAQVPEGALMARAATGLAGVCREWLRSVWGQVRGARVVVLAGSGNNGGDALYAAADLARRGATVVVVPLGSAIHPGGLAAVRRSGGKTVVAADAEEVVASADLVLDGIVGIGGHGPLRPEAAVLARAGAGRIIAVDLPSGVDPDTGAVEDAEACVAAEVTVTFGALKPALVLPPGHWQAGVVELVDIGLEKHLGGEPELETMDLATATDLIRCPTRSDDKYTRGVVGVVAGSVDYPGAGILCTGASRFGGVGMVRYAGGAPDVVVPKWPDVVPAHEGPAKAGRVQAWIVGPGAGTDEAARNRLVEVLQSDVPVLVDADAITLVSSDDRLRSMVVERSAVTLFTPHEGEFARLGGDLSHPGGRAQAVRRLAADLDSVVLLKGACTVVAAATGTASVSIAGPPDLATAGSGDVLAGLLGSMIAGAAATRDLTPVDVRRLAAGAAYIHGVAGRIAAAGGRPIVSDDVLGALPEAIASGRQGSV